MVLTLLIIAFVVWVVAFRLFEVASAAIHILIALAIFRLIFRLSWGSPRKLPPAPPDRPAARARRPAERHQSVDLRHGAVTESAVSVGNPLIRRCLPLAAAWHDRCSLSSLTEATMRKSTYVFVTAAAVAGALALGGVARAGDVEIVNPSTGQAAPAPAPAVVPVQAVRRFKNRRRSRRRKRRGSSTKTFRRRTT